MATGLLRRLLMGPCHHASVFINRRVQPRMLPSSWNIGPTPLNFWVVFMNNSLFAPPLPEEADQQ